MPHTCSDMSPPPSHTSHTSRSLSLRPLWLKLLRTPTAVRPSILPAGSSCSLLRWHHAVWDLVFGAGLFAAKSLFADGQLDGSALLFVVRTCYNHGAAAMAPTDFAVHLTLCMRCLQTESCVGSGWTLVVVTLTSHPLVWRLLRLVAGFSSGDTHLTMRNSSFEAAAGRWVGVGTAWVGVVGVVWPIRLSSLRTQCLKPLPQAPAMSGDGMCAPAGAVREHAVDGKGESNAITGAHWMFYLLALIGSITLSRALITLVRVAWAAMRCVGIPLAAYDGRCWWYCGHGPPDPPVHDGRWGCCGRCHADCSERCHAD